MCEIIGLTFISTTVQVYVRDYRFDLYYMWEMMGFDLYFYDCPGVCGYLYFYDCPGICERLSV